MDVVAPENLDGVISAGAIKYDVSIRRRSALQRSQRALDELPLIEGWSRR